MAIRVLASEVINQIAAGEVVDRPAAVVRELVDNACDAGADDISVFLLAGGQQLIKVVDNGCGMDESDARLAFERHATSKIVSAGDLLSVATLGFRGEALAAIASVSKVRLRTRTQDAPVATEIRIEAGSILGVTSVPGPGGTEIEVASLFYNTPARRKFQKSARSEESRIKNWLESSSLCRPGIRYRLFLDGREVLNMARRSSMLERAAALVGGNTVSFEEHVGPCRVSGVLAHPAQAEASSQTLVILANRRLISDKVVARAVKEGFSGTLKDREFPVGVVHIELPASEIDVNVHPQKSEVRFANPQAVFLAVKNATARAIRAFKLPINGFGESSGVVTGGNGGGAPAENPFNLRAVPDSGYSAGPSQDSATLVQSAARAYVPQSGFLFGSAGGVSAPAQTASASPATEFKFSRLRYIGQLFECYLLCELEGIFYVVDMHAAHERLNYNLLMAQWAERSIAVQPFLLPLKLELTSRSLDSLREKTELLRAFGFEIRVNGALEVLASPAMLDAGAAGNLLKEVAALESELDPLAPLAARAAALAARIACHASIRSGQRIKSEEVLALFVRMDAADFSAACPHGRPAVVSFSQAQMERWFGRIE